VNETPAARAPLGERLEQFALVALALVTDRKIYPPLAALHRTIWPFSRSPVPV